MSECAFLKMHLWGGTIYCASCSVVFRCVLARQCTGTATEQGLKPSGLSASHMHFTVALRIQYPGTLWLQGGLPACHSGSEC